ncbi:MAG: DNA recombination protein RmuC [Erysipelotrichaceae bacterium]|nr:DNA recombination protein RmuC [Erysipelotrichaceae bacterium]
MNEFILALLGIVIVLMLVLLIVFLRSKMQQEILMRDMANRQNQQTMEQMNDLKEKVTRDLMQFEFQMTQTVKSDLNQLNESTMNRLHGMESRVNQSLIKSLQTTSQAFTEMMQQIARIDETQKNLQDLSGSIASLQNVLTDKKTRGTFGEVELYSLLEMVFGTNEQRFQKQVKLANGSIVDALLLAPKPMGNIPIDSKFPLENYNRMMDDTLSQPMKQQAEKMFRQDVTKHLKDIANKYVNQPETAEFAYMFVPAEAVFAYIYGKMDDLIQMSYQYKVYIVSPTTLMAYITAIKAIYLGQKRDENAALIQQEYLKLSQEFERFSSRWEVMMKDYEKVYRDMQSISITSDKIQRRFEQISTTELEER